MACDLIVYMKRQVLNLLKMIRGQASRRQSEDYPPPGLGATLMNKYLVERWKRKRSRAVFIP